MFNASHYYLFGTAMGIFSHNKSETPAKLGIILLLIEVNRAKKFGSVNLGAKGCNQN